MTARRILFLAGVALLLILPLASALLAGTQELSAIGPEFATLLVTLHCMWICILLGPQMHWGNFWDEYVDDVERLMDAPAFHPQTLVDPKSLPLVICGCCRDVEAHLPSVLASLHRIGSRFQSYRIVIFENDSRDATRTILEAEHSRVPGVITLLLEDGMASPHRTERLAHIRNRLLGEARTLDPEGKGLLLMIDMDDVAAEGTLAETIDSCFHYPFESWDALATNRQLVYYDIYALRIRGHIEFDFTEMCRKYPSLEGRRKYFIRFRGGIRRSRYLLPVLSAFGGAALYKMAALRGKHYVGLDSAGLEICEHLSVHEQMIREGRRIFINTHMVTA